LAVSAIVAGPTSLMLCLEILRANQRGEQMRRAALTDPLTGLPNRAALLDRLNEAIDACQRAGQTGALLYIDLDHFKMINDHHGHAGGDAALRHAAQIMRETVEPGMVLGRFGGEEFVAFAHDSGKAAATAMAMILALRSTSAQHHGTDISVTASIGIAVMGDAATPEALLANAIAAQHMHAATRGGAPPLDRADLAADKRPRDKHHLVDPMSGDEPLEIVGRPHDRDA
jgi:diguanylate cyclase (GGDEF)-like protein